MTIKLTCGKICCEEDLHQLVGFCVCQLHVYVCVCERERENKTESESEKVNEEN